MTVIMLDTGKRTNVPDCYGARLIEQGKAVIAPAPAPVSPAKKAEEKQEPAKDDA